MRTKALLVGAMIGAASLATSMAQVYSVNIVGYVNTALPNGFTMVHNPLKASPDNTLASVIPAPAHPITLYKWNGTGYSINTFDPDLGWDDPTMSVAPGEGFFAFNPSTAITLTFVGEVSTGETSIPLVVGFNMIGSKVPQAGLLQTDLKYTPSTAGDTIYKWTGTGYGIYNFDPDLGWDPEPSIGVGEAFWAYRTGPGSWLRTFNVGP